MPALATPISSTKIQNDERDQILKMIDEFTATTTARSLIPASELMDFALDLRLILQELN